MSVTITTVPGPAAQARAHELARLRIAVFREFPYLYDGTVAYEERYLDTYFRAASSVVVLAEDETGHLVGASTGLPLASEEPAFRKPLEDRGYDAARVFYCGESVLLPEFRGRGLGRRFMDAREQAARALGAEWMTFCAVVRAEDHPLRPRGYSPLDAFWTGLGFAKVPGLTATYRWKVVGEAAESDHLMQFWMRKL